MLDLVHPSRPDGRLGRKEGPPRPVTREPPSLLFRCARFGGRAALTDRSPLDLAGFPRPLGGLRPGQVALWATSWTADGAPLIDDDAAPLDDQG
jgi:hypothetical protein